MADTRELILARLLAIGQAELIPIGLKTAVRNRGLMDNESRPAIAILDGDEQPRIVQPQARTNSRYTFRPQLLGMTPEIYLLWDELRPMNEEAAVNLGSKLNQARILLCQAISADSNLAALLGPNGGIVYNGCVTDLKSGLALSGQMRLDFEFKYFFDPST